MGSFRPESMAVVRSSRLAIALERMSQSILSSARVSSARNHHARIHTNVGLQLIQRIRPALNYAESPREWR